jgi:hypothetical protein
MKSECQCQQTHERCKQMISNKFFIISHIQKKVAHAHSKNKYHFFSADDDDVLVGNKSAHKMHYFYEITISFFDLLC